MKPEEIIHAMTDIDSTFLREAREISVPPRRSHRFAVLLAAVIALMAVTACAAGEVGGWLEAFFTYRSGSNLTSPQLQYIEKHGQSVNNSQTHDNYSVALKAYIGTKDTVYIVFHITAPPKVNIASEDFHIMMKAEFTGIYGRNPEAVTIRRMDDSDGKSNTIYYICILEHKDYLYFDVPEWNIHIDNLFRIAYNPQTNQRDFPVLAEGPWDYTIDLTKADTQTIELLTEPIQTLGIVPSLQSDMESVEKLTITSAVLSPLDMIITYEPVNECNVSFVGFLANTAIELHAYAIMKDGSEVPFTYGFPSCHGEAKLLADTPIVLDEVDYVLLADGTRLYAP